MSGERGAHLVSLAVNSPSIFEVLAEENLETTLRPAFEYLIKFIIDKYPDCEKYLKHYNELYLALDLIIQHHFLKHYSSSFAENFYGLKRVSLDQKHRKLPSNVHRKSLLFLAIFPYVKLLMANKFKSAREAQADGIESKNEHLRQLYLRIYPYVHFGLETVIIYYLIAFTLGKMSMHSPFLRLSGSKLAVQSQLDVTTAMQTHFRPKIAAKSLTKIVYGIFDSTIHNAVVGITWTLSTGAFFVQFLEWWNKSKESSVSWNYAPPAPTVNQLTIKIDARMCPLCLNKRTNDTALTTSGYVFCYRCIHQHVQQHCACPITKYVSNLAHLVRLYPPN